MWMSMEVQKVIKDEKEIYVRYKMSGAERGW